MHLVWVAPGFGSVQVDEQTHDRNVDAACVAVNEEAAPAKDRHFRKLDKEL